MIPNTTPPKSPKYGDCCIMAHKAVCGCVYDVRCKWNGQYWLYVSDQWCKPHGFHGSVIEVKPDNGTALATAPENPLAKFGECMTAQR